MIKRFFLADDDQDDIDIFRDALFETDESIEFHFAKNGRDLVSAIKSGVRPQIIFLDINMSGMTGWECLDTLQKDEVCKTIPVVMYSTSSVLRDGRRAVETGALCFLEKPSSFERLKDFLSRIYRSSEKELINTLRDIEECRTHRLIVA